MSKQSIRVADLTRSQFKRALAAKRLPPELTLDNLSTDQTVALALWTEITRRVSLPARASRIVFAMAERNARAILSEPGRWLFIAAWLADEQEPLCVFSRHAAVMPEPGDGLTSLCIIPLANVARDVLGRLDAPGRGALAVAA